MNNYALYIHFPFCLKRCPYCAFAAEVYDKDLAKRYLAALHKEIRIRMGLLTAETTNIKSLYFGGGTPSLMSEMEIGSVIDLLNDYCNFSMDIETTLEANPASLNHLPLKHLLAYRSAGINRFSIGAQSFNSHELKILGRIHSVEDILETVHRAREADFQNISLDLIYGFPGQSLDSLNTSLDQFFKLDVEHLSTYSLSIEPGTVFERNVRNGVLAYPNPDITADMFADICNKMSAAGYEHYELTNFSKPGRWSRHNFAYWERTPYLGFGTGAHSFDGKRRCWNTRDTHKYIEQLNENKLPCTGSELITGETEIEEIAYLSLRTRKGLDIDFAHKYCSMDRIEYLLSQDIMEKCHEKLHVKEEHWLLLDEIVAEILRNDMNLT